MSESQKKRGRPSSGLAVDVRVRIKPETNRKLLQYCKKYDIQRAPAIRQAIEEMLDRDNSQPK